MSFDAYWKRLTDATPGLRNHGGSMRIGVLAFREAIRRAYETGRADALDDASEQQASSMPDWMQKLFGRRP
jgi:hypothetical protein